MSESSVHYRKKPVRAIYSTIWAIAGFAFILLSIACLAVTIWGTVISLGGITTMGPDIYFLEVVLLGVCAIFGFGGYGLLRRGMRSSAEKVAFDQANITTEANVLNKVVREVKGAGYADDIVKYIIVIQFETDTGQVSLRSEVSKDLYDRLTPDKSLNVQYAKEDPRIALLEGEF